MSYFAINANCKLCNNNLNLFTFKTRYKFQDGWLCSKCYKKLNIPTYNSKLIISDFIKNDSNNKEKDIIINIAGTTFINSDGADRQDIIKKIIDNGVKYEYLIPYNGLSIKDMKQELYDQLYEFDGQELSKVKFEETIINNNKAIKVLLDDFNDNYIEVGYIPKDKIKTISDIINNQNYKVKCFIKGGRYKKINYYVENYQDNEEIIENELNYGLQIKILIN